MSDASPAVIRLDPAAPARIAPLARFEFGREVPLEALAPCAPEHWIGTADPREREREREGIRYREDGRWLMGHLRLDATVDDDLDPAAFAAYRQLAAFNAASGYPHLLRVWNFMDRLNEGAGDAERYRRFCLGRHRAIAHPGFERRLPAASVIGTQTPGLVLSFLAGREPGVQIENPRQTSAFRYPRDYGPVSPSFSRATLAGSTLLVSGTAAVVGHDTLHPHDAGAQMREILANFATLLAQAASLATTRSGWQPQALRLYVRNERDAAQSLAALRAQLGTEVPVAVLQGDISRADLAAEVEGVWSAGQAG